MRWLMLLLVLAGCDPRSFWGDTFLGDNQDNCETNPAGCPAGTACDPVSKLCRRVVDGAFLCKSSGECSMDEHPVCVQESQSCAACTRFADPRAADQSCAARGIAGSRLCISGGADDGRCRECRTPADCTFDPARTSCDLATHRCRGCGAHTECPDPGLCRLDDGWPGAGAVAAGACYPAGKVCVVDGDACRMAMQDGSPAHPYCDVTGVAARCSYLVLRPGKAGRVYGALSVGSGAVAAFGPGREAQPQVVLSGAEASGAGASVALVGLAVEKSGTAVSCTDGARVMLREVLVRKSGIGVWAEGCAQLTIERSQVTGNRNDGVHLGLGTRDYRIVNSLIAGNAADPGAHANGVYFQAGKGSFAFNTVVRNGVSGRDEGGVYCDVPALLNDTIVADNSQGMNGTQLGGTCQLMRVVVGTDSTQLAGAMKVPANLDPATGHLTAASTCCIDMAKDDRSVQVDCLGTLRPQRKAYDIGFHELP